MSKTYGQTLKDEKTKSTLIPYSSLRTVSHLSKLTLLQIVGFEVQQPSGCDSRSPSKTPPSMGTHRGRPLPPTVSLTAASASEATPIVIAAARRRRVVVRVRPRRAMSSCCFAMAVAVMTSMSFTRSEIFFTWAEIETDKANLSQPG